MPELPEVETTCRGIRPHLTGRRIEEVIVRERRLRHPVSPEIESIRRDRFLGVSRRAKYLILELERRGSLLVHLGMSGSLRISSSTDDFRKHDHLAIRLDSGHELRFHDPRRFGIFLHLPEGDPLDHPLLANLGPEPLGGSFSAETLKAACVQRRAPIKQVIMDPRVVVGVGNIYASEALFHAGIRPTTPAHRISLKRAARLAESISETLTRSIEQGGTTLRDFLHSTGEPGYFRQQLTVYDRANMPCRACGSPIRHRILGQRSTYWCPSCQR